MFFDIIIFEVDNDVKIEYNNKKEGFYEKN